MPVRFECNGRAVEVDDQFAHPHVSLLSWLRATGATGSKEGCAEGECGACAVAFRQRDSRGRAQYIPVNSCLLPLAAVHGRQLLTVEGIAADGGELHPVQRALVEHAGSQCGYCTPGFVVSMFCEYYRPERSGFDPDALSGNLCRCTGYRPILSAARSLGAPAPGDPQSLRLARAPHELPSYSYRYVARAGAALYARPSSLSELFALWAQEPAAVPIAGGTDLMVYVNQRAARYPALLALEGVAALRECSADERGVQLGAALPLSELGQQLSLLDAGDFGMLSQLLPLFASRLIRNRATLGGNLATASPIGDAAPVLLALGAQLCLVSAAGERRLPLREFFTGYRQQALEPQELIASVYLPRPAPPLQRFYKVSKRVLDDISTVSAAFALELAADRSVRRFRAAYGGVAPLPLMAAELEPLACGRPWDAQTCKLLSEAVRGLVRPIDDQRGSAAYRAALAGSLLEKFFEDSAGAVLGEVRGVREVPVP